MEIKLTNLDSIKSELGLDAISTSEVDETIVPILRDNGKIYLHGQNR